MSPLLKIIGKIARMSWKVEIVLLLEQVKTYGIDLNVEELEDDRKNIYSNTYLTKIRNTPISLEPYVDIEEDFDVMMA